ncbi:MAG: metallophosphoesterase family protein [Actinomycetota bacterium]
MRNEIRLPRTRRILGAIALTLTGSALLGLVAAGPAGATDPTGGISQVKLSYRGDPTTSVVVSWRDASTTTTGSVQVGVGASLGDCPANCSTVQADRRLIGSSDGAPYAFYQAELSGLKPGTGYSYRVNDGGTPSPVFRFGTPAGGNSALRAAFVGEVHIGDAVQPGSPTPALAPVLGQISASGAQFVQSTGDNVNTGSLENEWERLFGASPSFFGSTPYLTAIGNHETYGGFGKGVPAATVFGNFPQPTNGDGSGRYYSYDVNGVHIAVVEANPETPKAYFTSQLAWLTADLAAAKERTRFQIVVTHSPPFHSKTSRVTPTYENPEFRDSLVPIMDKYGVEMVISGHDKHYVRSYPLNGKKDRGAVPEIAPKPVRAGSGTTYIELTSTGQNYADFLQQDWMAKSDPVSAEYLQLDFGTNEIQAKAIRPDGSVLDQFSVPRVR